MAEIILSFETQEQADNAATALSKGYKVKQYRAGGVNDKCPYCVRVYVPDIYVFTRRADI